MIFSCVDTKFSTTKREFKGGRYVNVKKKNYTTCKWDTQKILNQNNRGVRDRDVMRVRNNQIDTEHHRILQLASREISPELLAGVIARNTQFSSTFSNISSQESLNNLTNFSESVNKTVDKLNKRQGGFIWSRQDITQLQSIPDTVYVKTKQPEIYTKRKTVSVGGFVCGIIGFILSGIIFGPIALVLGIVGLRKVKKQPNKYKGKGFAIASLILGIVDIIGVFIAIAILL